MLSSTFPYPPSRGGTHVRTFSLLKSLSQNHQITLVTQTVEDITQTQMEELQQWVKELVIFNRPVTPQGNVIQKTRRLIQSWYRATPPNVLFLHSEEMQKWIDQAVSKNRFDLITCEHSVNEIYVRPEWKQSIKSIINIHSSVYRTCLDQLRTNTSENPLRDRLYLPLFKRYEQQFCHKFSEIVVTTKEDKQQIQEFYPQRNITIIPNGVDLELFPYRPCDPGGHKLIITGGMDYIFNIDAACFFSLEILPLIQAKYPDTTLTIVGSKPAPEVLALAERPGITVTGRVPYMPEYLHQATICVIPMRSGFGMKLKTVEAMATGIPLVASDCGLEGLEVDSPDVPLCALRANRVPEYVEAITRLFEDGELRSQLSQNARNFIEKDYTWENIGKQYEQVLCNDVT